MRKQRPTYLELAVLREAAAVGATMRSSLIKAGIVTVKGSSATLNRLESKGWIRSDVDLGPPPHGGWKRRVYTITKLGQQMLDGENTLTPPASR